MFDAIRKKIEKVNLYAKPSGISFIMNDVLQDKTIQAQILDLNTEEQLYRKGVDSEGISLGGYAPYTIEYKRRIAGGLGNDTRIDHITLKDTGEFYKSFRFVNQKQGFKITANTIKDGGDDLLNISPDIIGLTDESLQEVGQMVTEPFVDTFRRLI